MSSMPLTHLSRFAAISLIVALPGGCTTSVALSKDDSPVVLAHHTLDAPDPSKTGSYTVRYLNYGSGTDKRRPAFRDSVSIRTASLVRSPTSL